jgi:hypothetical protein
MDEGIKFILWAIVALVGAYFAGSLFFPELIEGINLTPIRFHWDAF